MPPRKSPPSSCVIFDFDGVIADTEILHLAAYNHAFAHHAKLLGKSLQISHADYFSRYIAYGDREGFQLMLRDAALPHTDTLIHQLILTKAQLFETKLHEFAEPLPGVRNLLAWLEERNVPRAICSGAHKKEIEHLLEAFNLRPHFDLIIAIEDVRYGKPDPEGYSKAFDQLHEIYDANLQKKTSLVIEDSAGGCAAAKAAKIPVLGVATSLPLKEVAKCADHAVNNLSELDLTQLSHWLAL